MTGSSRLCSALLCTFVLSGFWPVLGAKSIPKLDRAWKRYRNAEWGYCVSYPSRWLRGDAYEGAGLFVATGVKKFSNPIGEIDVAALPRVAGTDGQVDLPGIVKVHLEGLQKFERAEQVQILETRKVPLLGDTALFTKERYYDPLDRATWLGELVFASHQNVVYRLELMCRSDQADRFEPVFTRVLNTFQFECGAVR